MYHPSDDDLEYLRRRLPELRIKATDAADPHGLLYGQMIEAYERILKRADRPPPSPANSE